MTVRILVGDVMQRLAELSDESVNCVVTSPPYWGLRDYGIPPSIWGGDPLCAHEWGADVVDRSRATPGTSGSGLTNAGAFQAAAARFEARSAFCTRCGAWRGCFGLEPTYQLYVDHAVAVFREVRRVLRSDGTLWLNLGDSYANSTGAQGVRISTSDDPSWHGGQLVNHPKRKQSTADIRAAGLKPKDLVGIPWKVALALQADGWWLRQDVIWSKPNPMPESVRDRTTRAHEYLFHLAKAERYYYDADAIAEPASPNTHARVAQDVAAQAGSARANGGSRPDRPMKAVISRRKLAATGRGIRANASFENATSQQVLATRNKRSVWTVASEPFPDAHFATFPPTLIEPCILAGCPKGGTVLDPFGGAGTTGLVADRQQRDAILIEINRGYAEMARARIARDQRMLGTVEVVEAPTPRTEVAA